MSFFGEPEPETKRCVESGHYCVMLDFRENEAWLPYRSFFEESLTTSLGRNISVWIYCQIVLKMASERIVIAGLFVFIFCQAFSSTAGRFVRFLTWFREMRKNRLKFALPALCEKSHCNFTQKRVCFIRITWGNTQWRKHCRGLQFSRKSWYDSQGRNSCFEEHFNVFGIKKAAGTAKTNPSPKSYIMCYCHP